MEANDKETAPVFRGHGDDGYVDMAPGIRRRTLAHGERTLIASFSLDAGSRIPEHSHPEEQTGFLVSGHITFHFGGAAHETRPGDAWAIPGGVIHSVDVREDSVAVEVFAPVRKDYL